MKTTTYYDLNIVEGTDIVNPLTVDNPNYQKIDETMHDNAVAGVTLATELTNATIHALTRENSDCSVIRFIATSRWKAGDSMTVDGVPVLALLPSGETLPDGAYVINANVLCVLTGTNLTVYVSKSAANASDITYNETNVEEALNSLNESMVTVTSDLSTVSSNVSTLTTSLEEVSSNLNSEYQNYSGTVSLSAVTDNIVKEVTVQKGIWLVSAFVNAVSGNIMARVRILKNDEEVMANQVPGITDYPPAPSCTAIIQCQDNDVIKLTCNPGAKGDTGRKYVLQMIKLK